MDNGSSVIKKDISYEWAQPSDWTECMSLVWTTFMEFEGPDYTPEGVGHFFEFITDDKLHDAFINGKYPMMIGRCDGRIVGVGSLRSSNRLSLLFVHREYHHMGIATAIVDKLCKYLRDICHEDSMVVRAAPYAVDFYKKTGFKVTEPERDISGIKVTTMELVF